MYFLTEIYKLEIENFPVGSPFDENLAKVFERIKI
jgi:hypothetical protein